MPKIDIRRPHHYTLHKARNAVKKTAAAMAEKFDIESSWSGNTLNFNRSGVSGAIHISATEIHVVAELGFLLGMLKPAIEREIEQRLEQDFR